VPRANYPTWRIETEGPWPGGPDNYSKFRARCHKIERGQRHEHRVVRGPMKRKGPRKRDKNKREGQKRDKGKRGENRAV
jgi:hypothetical protein